MGNMIRIKLPGKRSRLIGVNDNEKVGSLKIKMANILGVKAQNWGIYSAKDNKPLQIVDDNKQIKHIDQKNLYFYPKIVIR